MTVTLQLSSALSEVLHSSGLGWDAEVPPGFVISCCPTVHDHGMRKVYSCVLHMSILCGFGPAS
jgi:hypothetical protein